MSKGIYKITNKTNGKCYIGKSLNIEERWQYHIAHRNVAREYNKPLYCAFRKYGIENFSFEIVEEINNYEEIANEREKYWIEYFNSYGSTGYNATKGGDGGETHDMQKKFGKLTAEDVKQIRLEYAKCETTAAEIYENYKDRISKRGFQAIWLGENWKKIMPEVFTEENKRKHLILNRQREGKIRRGLI